MEFFNIHQLWYILRMIVACACGVMIGLERRNRSKEAGVRTHCVVACASALMMIISKYGFADTVIGENGVRGADGARIWATSGVGLAIGAGMYVVGITATVIIIAAQILLHKNFRWLKNSKSKRLVIKNVNIKGYQAYMTSLLAENGVVVHDVYIEKNEDSNSYTFIIELPQNVSEEQITDLVDFKCKLSANM